MFDLAVVGSANLDLVVTVDRHPAPGETVLGTSYAEYPGGKGLNQAVAAGRCGASVTFIGSLGDDAAGRTLASLAASEGIDLAHCPTGVENPTGRAAITVGADGDNSIVVVPGANSLVTSPSPFPPCRVALAQLEIPLQAVEAAFRSARAAGGRTVLNPAPAHDLPPALLDLCDVVIPNEHEVRQLGGADALHRSGVEVVIVTQGAAGVSVSRAGVVTTHRAMQVEAVDTTGAGDAFCGNFAARLAAGASIDDAVEWAIAAAGLAVTISGAVPSLPHASATSAAVNSS